MVEWWLAWFTTLAAAALGWFWNWHIQQVSKREGAKTVEETLTAARHEAEVCIREAQAHVQEMKNQALKDFDLEFKERRQRLEMMEDKHHERAMLMDTRSNTLDSREAKVEAQLKGVEQASEQLSARNQEFEELMEAQRQKLQEISGLTPEKAREEILLTIKDDVSVESAQFLRHAQRDMQSKAKQEAQKIITYAIERYAAETVHDVTTTSVQLPSEEMKGRIIGKEGRNIRSIESATGVNVMIDDTPQMVILSGFDPMRREIARIALERLIHDGRIHPASIEETVERVQEEVEVTVRKAGENAVFELGLTKIDPEVVQTLGRLKYRQSYSQNVLNHSLEMAHLMGSMAAELGLDIELSKRIGLLHDIGKALTHEVEGSHAIIGGDLIKKYGEKPIVVNAVAAHHREVEPESVYAHLAMAADAITAARPGARNENTHQYLKRLGDLEEIANACEGVSRSYAIQAGRELRVLVEPNDVSDDEALALARHISNRIEKELQFPGQVKVTVIRETRSIEYAR